MVNTDSQNTSRLKPAEKALLKSLKAQQLRLVASWLREELSLNAKEYTPSATKTKKRLDFIANRLDDVARQLDSSDDNSDNNSDEKSAPEAAPGDERPNGNLPDTDEDKPWRFSDEYWHKYESDDD